MQWNPIHLVRPALIYVKLKIKKNILKGIVYCAIVDYQLIWKYTLSLFHTLTNWYVPTPPVE